MADVDAKSRTRGGPMERLSARVVKLLVWLALVLTNVFVAMALFWIEDVSPVWDRFFVVAGGISFFILSSAFVLSLFRPRLWYVWVYSLILFGAVILLSGLLNPEITVLDRLVMVFMGFVVFGCGLFLPLATVEAIGFSLDNQEIFGISLGDWTRYERSQYEHNGLLVCQHTNKRVAHLLIEPSPRERVTHSDIEITEREQQQAIFNKCLNRLGIQHLHYVAYYRGGTCLYSIDVLDDGALREYFRGTSKPPQRRKFYKKIGKQMNRIVWVLDRHLSSAEGGPLIRTVFDVEKGAVYFYSVKWPEKNSDYIIGVTLEQGRVNACARQMAELIDAVRVEVYDKKPMHQFEKT